MGTIQVRDLDDDVVERYRALAELEGKSLQQYMKEFLTQQSRKNTNREIFDEISRSGMLRESSVTLEEIVDDIRALRDQS